MVDARTKLEIVASVNDLATRKFQDMRQAVISFNIGLKNAGMNTENFGNKFMIAGAKIANFFKRFNMDILSLIFGGMAIQRVFGGVLRSLYTSFMKVENYQSAAHRSLMGVQAAWEVLKFTIFNALNQSSLFKAIIEGLIWMLNSLQRIFAEHPNLSLFVMGFAALAVAVGTLLVSLGFLAQSIYSISLLWPFISKTAVPAIKSIGTALWGISTNPIVLVTTAILAAAIAVAYLIWMIGKASDRWGGFGNWVEAVAASIVLTWAKAFDWIIKNIDFVVDALIFAFNPLIGVVNAIMKIKGMGSVGTFVKQIMPEMPSIEEKVRKFDWVNTVLAREAVAKQETGKTIGEEIAPSEFVKDMGTAIGGIFGWGNGLGKSEGSFTRSAVGEEFRSKLAGGGVGDTGRSYGVTNNVNVTIEGSVVSDRDLQKQMEDIMSQMPSPMKS